MTAPSFGAGLLLATVLTVLFAGIAELWLIPAIVRWRQK